MKKFKFLQDEATADIAFEATASSLNELFEAAAEAVTETMVKRKMVHPVLKKLIQLRAGSVQDLLYDFLSELIFMKDTEGILCSAIAVEIDEKDCSLAATIEGEYIDYERHKLGSDVKAVTLHKFSLKKEGKQYTAHVILDI